MKQIMVADPIQGISYIFTEGKIHFTVNADGEVEEFITEFGGEVEQLYCPEPQHISKISCAITGIVMFEKPLDNNVKT